MKSKKNLLCVLVSLALLTAGCGGGEKKQEAKPAPNAEPVNVLKVGMDAAYPPFGSQDIKTKEYVGFDVDIIKAIGAEEGFKAEIQNLPFDGLIPALKTGNIDVAINDITINEERAQSVDFSKRYYIAGLGVVVKKDNNTIKTVKDLEGKRLGVSIGSTGEEAARKIPNAQVKVFNQLNEAFLEAKNNGVDAVINDIPTNEYYANTTGREDVKTVELALTQEDLGIAVKKGNKKLLTKIDSGLAKIKKNGEFTKIYKKWFGKEPPKILLDE
ncbi:MAG: basic amino acid ABC transporter substrate-binding protein [Acidaminococcaceae bacterium]|nr:basic amino acid ABC transporter substrate-binding protein [Acidaminococcaceae bacterium]